MKAKVIVLALLISLCVINTGCGAVSDSATLKVIEDFYGDEISVPENPNRVAAVYGPSYEALAVLDAEDKIVVCADVQRDNFPWALKIFDKMANLPYLNNVHTAVNIEEVLKYSPELVFSFSRPNEINQLQKSGVSSIAGVSGSSLDDTKKLLKVYAEALGEEAIAAYDEYAEYFDEKISMVKAVTDNIDDADKPSVYYAGTDILTTYGKYSDMIDVITIAGGKAVTEDLEAGNRTQINYEQLAQWNPDYIFIDHGGINDKADVEEIMDDTYADSRYSIITAVNSEQIYLSPSGVFYWDMGLQKVLLVMYMAKILHPEEFAELDMVKEIQIFYENFFDYALTDEEAAKILNRENP